MPTLFHRQLLELGERLGYNKIDSGGTCFGYTAKWLESYLVHQEDQFNHFKAVLFKAFGTENILQKIDEVKEKVKHHSPLIPEEKDLLNLLVFFETMKLFHGFEGDKDWIGHYYNQKDFSEVSKVASLEAVQKRGGLVSVHSEIGLYSLNELKALFESYEKIIDHLRYPEDEFAILLGNGRHTVGVVYQKSTTQWRFKDINEETLEIPEVKTYEQIAQDIFDGLNFGTPHVPLETTFVFLNDVAVVYQLKMQLKAWTFPQRITTEVAHRLNIENFAVLAAAGGYLDVVKTLIAHGVDFNQSNDKGTTPLYMASQNNYLEIVLEILEHHITPNQSKDAARSLYVASQLGHDDVVKALLELGADSTIKSGYNEETPLFIAASKGHLNCLKAILKYNKNFNEPNNSGETPLYMASQNGHLPVVLELLSCGADPSQPTHRFGTPLYIASQEGYLDIVIELLRYPLNLDFACQDGSTPLYVAVQNNHSQIALELLRRGANPNCSIQDVAPILAIAIFHGNLDIVLALLEHGAEANQTDHEGYTALHFAAENGQFEMVEKLIEYGSSINQASPEGKTAAYFAALNGKTEVIAILAKYHADFNIPTQAHVTPLFIVAQKGHASMVSELVKYGANFDIPFTNSVLKLREFSKKHDESIQKRMESFLLFKAISTDENEMVTMLPIDIAHIMGHEQIVQFLKLEQAKQLIETMKKTIEVDIGRENPTQSRDTNSPK